MRRVRMVATGMLIALALAAAAAAQQPKLANAKLETRSAAAGLEKTFRPLASEAGPLWVGYAAPLFSRQRKMCCWTSSDGWRSGAPCDGPCTLEKEQDFNVSSDDRAGPKLEGDTHFWVLFRVEGGKVGKVLTFSEDCELDAGGLRFVWLTDVKPAESVAMLSSLALASADSEEGKISKRAVTAIALHDDPAAERALEDFVNPARPEVLRKHSVFWLGAERGRKGYEILRRVARDDPSERVRGHAVFALSISKEPEAVDTMIDVARNDRSAHVRGQALFWLAQKAGKKAVGAISEAIERDPETAVKKKAVFALSQLPPDEGVPLLIQVARTNSNLAVRKQAFFWLGQSKDPRALAFFQEILKP